MKRPSIKLALTFVLGMIAVTVTGFAIISVSSMKILNSNADELATIWLPKVSISKEMNNDLSSLRRGYLNNIIALDSEARNAAETSVENARMAFDSEYEKYSALTTDDTEKEIETQIKEKFDQVVAIGSSVLDLSRAGKIDDAKLLQQTKARPLATEVEKLLAKVVKLNETGASESYQSSIATYSATVTQTYLIIALCLAVIGGCIYFAVTAVAKPIEKITSSMKALANGDSSITIPYQGRADEIGEMAAAVEVFRVNALANRQLEQEANDQRVATEELRQHNAQAERLKAAAMEHATLGLSGGLQHLSDGDLSFQLAESFSPEFESLRQNFNVSVTKLSDTLKAVAHAAGSIDSGSVEISRSAEDLSRRTEQQAASLEETAAALDEITVNVSNSSRRAEEARTVAVQANASAVESGKVVANAVKAMQKIEQSSNEVSNIIGVIDEIAFQTNLLALNAGVEAARAGDAGKGFAVVAQEVRELAQRSAKAAKEIKELIRNSSAEVQSGVKLVSDTGDALKTIEKYIVAVNQHMDSIATSAKEQSVGLGEVNIAVNQMDQVTQQNAAMVEETSAASSVLANESSKLRELINQFTLMNKRPNQALSLQLQSPIAIVVDNEPRSTGQSSIRAANRVSSAARGNAAAKGKDGWDEF